MVLYGYFATLIQNLTSCVFTIGSHCIFNSSLSLPPPSPLSLSLCAGAGVPLCDLSLTSPLS